MSYRRLLSPYLCHKPRIPFFSFSQPGWLASKPISLPTKTKAVLSINHSQIRDFSSQRNTQGSSPHGQDFASWRAPVPVFWRLVAVGTTFYFFFSVFNPFNPAGEQAEGKRSLQPTRFAKCLVYSVEASTPSEVFGNLPLDPHSKPHIQPGIMSPAKAEHILLQLGIPTHLLPSSNAHLGNAIYHLYIKDDDMQVERPYTPINGIGMDGKFTLWVKRYQGGEVSNWLSRLGKGRVIEVRGPIRQWDWREKEVDEIIMIAGGTGLAAFTQLLHQAFFPSQPVLSPTNSRTHFSLLHGHDSPSALPPPLIADDLAMYRNNNGDRFTEKCFIDQPDGEMDDIPAGVEIGRIGKEALERTLLERGILIEEENKDEQSASTLRKLKLWSKQTPKAKRRYINPDKRVMVLVCGPEGMICSIAGRRPRKSEALPDGGLPVGGILGELGFQPSQVVRL